MEEQLGKNELLDFVEYVDTFYNPFTGIYPIKGATVAVLTEAIKTYINSGDNIWGGGDSVDRERVRDIILERVGNETA